MTWIGRILYAVGRLAFLFIFRVIFSTQVSGCDRVPRSGGLLVVCNHISWADPPMLAVALPRPVEFMTMVEVFRIPVVGVLARQFTFPVDRSRPDARAAREAVRRLRTGHCVGLFPEAGIRLTEKSVLGGQPEFKPGAGLIALLGSAPILPVVVRDTRKPYMWRNWLPFREGRLRRATMSVMFGCPFCLWIPESLPTAERRRLAREVLRAELLKTVELT
ncbi:MAG: lysophospholipid acyltransferase family protein [Verrucomicrobiia bacterium]|jgi:1-acyl-sn-glycerol-3-phosphate acyltransferase